MSELSNPGKNGGRLKRLPKGVSGNPKGRPKKLPQIDALLAEVLGDEQAKGKDYATAILEAMRRKAINGDVKAAELLLNRAYGKATQPVNVSGMPAASTAPSVTVQVLPPSHGATGG